MDVLLLIRDVYGCLQGSPTGYTNFQVLRGCLEGWLQGSPTAYKEPYRDANKDAYRDAYNDAYTNAYTDAYTDAYWNSYRKPIRMHIGISYCHKGFRISFESKECLQGFP